MPLSGGDDDDNVGDDDRHKDKADEPAGPDMAPGSSGKRPAFWDEQSRLVGDLPPEHVPRYSPPGDDGDGREDNNDNNGSRTGKRLVFVGDVHGHRAALEALLGKIGFDHRRGDHLVLVGDVVAKGPDTKGVLDLAMELGASAVRGNHEDLVLAAARDMRRIGGGSGAGGSDDDDDDDDNSSDDDNDDNNYKEEEEKEEKGVQATGKKKRRRARKIARSLTDAQLAWLRSLPLILRIEGGLPDADADAAPWDAATLAVVHGGLVPGVALEEQDAWAVMNMRSLLYRDGGGGGGGGKGDGDTAGSALPISTHKGEPWSRAW